MRSAKCKPKNQERHDLSERLLDFAVEVARITARLGKTRLGRHVSDQLMRSGTAAGANYEEACSAERRAGFVHKLQIVLKELRESLYWLRLIQRAVPAAGANADIAPLLQEAEELASIIAKSIVTTKGR